MSEKKIATLDCETDPFCFGRVPKPFLWCIYDGREYHLYNDTKDVLKWLEGFDGIVYAHNGGKFDYHFLLDGIPNGTQVMVINGRIARLKLGKAQLRDSYNILPIPLAMMEKDDFEYWKMESSCRAQHMPEITQYLKNDCLYLHNYITQFIDMFGLHITQASCAFKKLHEIIGQDMPKKYGATGHRYYDFIKPFYFGGRVSCFKPGVHKGNFHYIDINSSYPFAMKHKHPWGSKHVTQKNIPDSKLHRSFLEVNCFSHGAFPFRDGLKTDFPHRQDTYFVTGYEFMAALETDTISDVKIKKGYVFKESIEFGAYVDKFFAMKKEAEENDRPADRLFAKLFLNSSYGKFGMNGEKHEQYSFEDIYPDWQKIEQWTKDGTKWKAHEIVGGHRLYSFPLPEERHTFHDVAVAASVTGFARGHLWKAINKVDTPYYCDTDSIICNGTGDLVLGSKLGEWSTEATGDHFALAGKKLYAFHRTDKPGYKIASKGGRLKPQEIAKLASGKVKSIKHRPEAPKFSLKNNIMFSEKNFKKTC